jgi:hypothetical protein
MLIKNEVQLVTFDPEGNLIRTLPLPIGGSVMAPPATLRNERGEWFLSCGIYEGDRFYWRTLKIGPDGEQLWSAQYLSPAGRDGLWDPQGLALDADGNLYVLGLFLTAKYSPNGSLLWASSDLQTAGAIVDRAGNVFSVGTVRHTAPERFIVAKAEPANQAAGLSVTARPAHQSIFAGETLFLEVEANAAEPLRFQWYHDWNLVEGATNATFRIEQARTDDAGLYTVEIAGASGVLARPDAEITVAPRVLQLFCTPKSGAAGYELRLTGPPGLAYTIQSSPDLQTWENVATGTSSAASGPILDIQPRGPDQLFYRPIWNSAP